MALAGVPAVMLTIGSILVVDTPNSLIERGRLDEGKAVLRKIRGTDNIEPEFLDIVEASRVSKQVKHPFKTLLQRQNRPQLTIAILLQVTSSLIKFINLFILPMHHIYIYVLSKKSNSI